MKSKNRFWNLILSGELQLIAAALSFSTVLSLIPFLAVSLATLQYVNGLETLYPKVESIALQYFQGPMGAEGMSIVQKVFKRIYAGRMGSWGAVVLILASILLINDMEKAIHRIWNLPDRRPLFQRIFFYWVSLIFFPMCLVVFVALTSLKIFGNVTTFIPISLLQTVLLFLALFLVYKVVPHTKVTSRSAATGAVLASIGLILLTKSFKWLSQSFFSWGKLYGSFAAIPALLIWILLIWYIVLLGAAITASFKDYTQLTTRPAR